RNRAHAPVRTLGLRLGPCGQILESRDNALVILMDLDDFGVEADQGTQLARKRLSDLAHAAHGLKHRRLEIVSIAKLQRGPETGMQQITQRYRLRKCRPGAQAAAGITVVTAPFTAVRAFRESVIPVKRAPHAQRVE